MLHPKIVVAPHPRHQSELQVAACLSVSVPGLTKLLPPNRQSQFGLLVPVAVQCVSTQEVSRSSMFDYLAIDNQELKSSQVTE